MFEWTRRYNDDPFKPIAIYWPEPWGESVEGYLRGDRVFYNSRRFTELNGFRKLIFAHDFDTIIMDIWKPEIREDKLYAVYDVNIIREIKEKFPECKIIVTSALEKNQIPAFFAGADYFFPIPFSIAGLLRAVKN